jgi:hypothetical protein
MRYKYPSCSYRGLMDRGFSLRLAPGRRWLEDEQKKIDEALVLLTDGALTEL